MDKKSGWYAHGQAQPPHVTIATDHCVGCAACAEVCRPRALRLMPGAWAATVDSTRCTACRRCATVCPFDAIAVSGTPRTGRQSILDKLAAALASNAPPDWWVHTADHNPGSPTAVIPDLAIVHDEQRKRTSVPAGSSDRRSRTATLVAEIVSATPRDSDLRRNHELHRSHGVAAFWTLNPRDGKVTVHWSDIPAWYDRFADTSFR